VPSGCWTREGSSPLFASVSTIHVPPTTILNRKLSVPSSGLLAPCNHINGGLPSTLPRRSTNSSIRMEGEYVVEVGSERVHLKPATSSGTTRDSSRLGNFCCVTPPGRALISSIRHQGNKKDGSLLQRTHIMASRPGAYNRCGPTWREFGMGYWVYRLVVDKSVGCFICWFFTPVLAPSHARDDRIPLLFVA